MNEVGFVGSKSENIWDNEEYSKVIQVEKERNRESKKTVELLTKYSMILVGGGTLAGALKIIFESKFIFGILEYLMYYQNWLGAWFGGLSVLMVSMVSTVVGILLGMHVGSLSRFIWGRVVNSGNFLKFRTIGSVVFGSLISILLFIIL